MSAANRVRELRIDLGWTQLALAKESGVSLRTIHSIEAGNGCMMATKRKILAAFGMEYSPDARRAVFGQ